MSRYLVHPPHMLRGPLQHLPRRRTLLSRCWVGVLCLVLSWVMAGCGLFEEGPPLPPDELLHRSSAAMLTLKSLHFVIELEGAPAYLDPQRTLSLLRAEGDVDLAAEPKRAAAEFRARTPIAVAKVKFVGIGSEQFLTNVLSGRWEPAPPGWGFDPAILFAPESGLQHIVGSLRTVRWVGPTRFDNRRHEQLQGVIDGEALRALTAGMIHDGDVTVALVVDGEAFYVRQMTLHHTPPGATEETRWRFIFSALDQPVTIVRPGETHAE